MEDKYIQTLTHEILDYRYVTVLIKLKVNGRDQNPHQRGLEKF